MTYKELKDYAKKNGVEVSYTRGGGTKQGDFIFLDLVFKKIIPEELRRSDWRNVKFGDLGLYDPTLLEKAPIESEDITKSVKAEIAKDDDNNRAFDFNLIGVNEFLKDLYESFKDTDYILHEFHVVAENQVTATVFSQSNHENKLHLKATAEGWLIIKKS